MTVANVLQANTFDLPQALRTAQDAMHLPEVQEMLERLSKYQLGIFMPHMHDEKTGEFQLLAKTVCKHLQKKNLVINTDPLNSGFG